MKHQEPLSFYHTFLWNSIKTEARFNYYRACVNFGAQEFYEK